MGRGYNAPKRKLTKNERRRSRYGPLAPVDGPAGAMSGPRLREQTGAAWPVVVAVVALIFLIGLVAPLAFVFGILTQFAAKFFELKGIQQAAGLFLKLTCKASGAVKGIGDVVSGADNKTGGALGALKDAVVSGAGFVSKGALKVLTEAGSLTIGQAVPGLHGTFDNVYDLTASAIDAGVDLGKAPMKFIRQLNDTACKLEDIYKELKRQGIDDALRAALNCANWPSYLGPMDKKFCIDDKPQDAHDTIPEWLLPIYQRAADEYNVPWQLLAAINQNDTDFGANPIWRIRNPAKHKRVGWIPMSELEWEGDKDKRIDGVKQDAGAVPPLFALSPYKRDVACPEPNAAVGSVSDGEKVEGITDTSADAGGGGGGSVAGLPGPKEGIATTYDPAAGGINGSEGGGSFAAVYHNGWAAARLGTTNYPRANWAWHGVLVKVTNKQNGKSVVVPINDIGPGGPPMNGHPRVIDLLPRVAHALGGDNPVVTLKPLRKISREEASKYGRGDKGGGAADGGGDGGDPIKLAADVASFAGDGSADTCDPVDSIFALAEWLAGHGVQGSTWEAALKADTGNSGGGGDEQGVEPSGDGSFVWPVKNQPKTIISPFSPYRCVAGLCRPHKGADIQASSGSTLVAVADGTVSLVQGEAASGGFGNFSCIRHDAEVTTCYAHQSHVGVKQGEKVKQGEVIGKSGCTGRCFGPHLHFEVRVDGGTRQVDPAPYLKGVKKVAGAKGGASSPDGGRRGGTQTLSGDVARFMRANSGSFPTLRTGLKPIPRPSRATCTGGDEPDSVTRLTPIWQSAGKTFGVDWRVLAGLTRAESYFGCNVGPSSAGAFGWTQFMPATWQSWGMDADGNGKAQLREASAVDFIFSTARYLRVLDKEVKARGDYKLILAAYNAGPGNVLRYGGVPPFAETQKYVSNIMAYAKSMGASGRLSEQLDDAIYNGVQARDHTINRRLCPDEAKYADCIARLYREIVGEDPNGGDGLNGVGGEVLGGACATGNGANIKVDTVPDFKVKPYTSKKVVRARTEEGKFVARQTYAREDAYKGMKAVVAAFQKCHPEYKKRWKDIQVHDWGGELIAHKYGFYPNSHLSHRNGGDNDFIILGVSSWNMMGEKYDRKLEIDLAAMFLRAGAYEIYFDDPKVQEFFRRRRASEAGKAKKKMGSHWNPNPVNTGGLAQPAGKCGRGGYCAHHDHDHVRWYSGGGNAMPAPIKVYLGKEDDSDQDKGDGGNGQLGPFGGNGGPLGDSSSR